MIDCENERPNEFPQVVKTRAHTFRADIIDGSTDSAPGPHDYFDAALASCKALTAMWYAKQKNIPLERVESHVDRDASKEREGTYTLKVRLAFHGPLTEEQKKRLYDVVAKCPVHRLMTTTDVVIETMPL